MARVSKRFLNYRFLKNGYRLFSSSNERDLVVIGSGPGGYVASIKAAQMGLKVDTIKGHGTIIGPNEVM
ncbi:unnamed protein product, partial [Protopolystoma xenopodis]